MTFQKGERLGAVGLALPDDGSLVAVGSAQTAAGASWPWAVRIDRRGSVAWEREWTSAGGGRAGFSAAAELRGGGVIAAGHGGSGALVTRIHGAGNTLWERAVRLAQVTRATSVVADDAGVVAIAGTLEDSGKPPSAFIARLDEAGGLVTRAVVEGRGQPRIAALGADGYLMIGVSDEAIAFDRSLDVRWRAKIGAALDAVALGAGDAAVSIAGPSAARVARLGAGGQLAWEREIGGPRVCGGARLWFAPPGRIAAVTGPCEGAGDLVVTWLSLDGAQLSADQVRARPGATPREVRRDGSGFAAVGGFSRDGAPESRQGWVLRSLPPR